MNLCTPRWGLQPSASFASLAVAAVRVCFCGPGPTVSGSPSRLRTNRQHRQATRSWFTTGARNGTLTLRAFHLLRHRRARRGPQWLGSRITLALPGFGLAYDQPRPRPLRRERRQQHGVSLLGRAGDRLFLRQVVSSGGVFPCPLSVHARALVYVPERLGRGERPGPLSRSSDISFSILGITLCPLVSDPSPRTAIQFTHYSWPGGVLARGLTADS